MDKPAARVRAGRVCPGSGSCRAPASHVSSRGLPQPLTATQARGHLETSRPRLSEDSIASGRLQPCPSPVPEWTRFFCFSACGQPSLLLPLLSLESPRSLAHMWLPRIPGICPPGPLSWYLVGDSIHLAGGTALRTRTRSVTNSKLMCPFHKRLLSTCHVA